MSGGLDTLIRELRAAVRVLAARPGWTSAVVLCLAIATAANTAAFTLVNGLLLRPLPFDSPDELVMVALQEPAAGSPRPFALQEYRDLAARSDTTAMLLARTFFPLSLAADDGARMAQAELVSGNYFETLRVRPFRGRFFDATADRVGAPPLAVLSHRLWQVRFGASDAVIGQAARVNGRPVILAGVTPPGFVGAMQLVAADLWLPAALHSDLAGAAAAATPMFGVMGRLAPDVSAERAAVRLTSVMQASGLSTPPSVMVRPATGFGVPVSLTGTVLTLSRVVYLMMALLMAVACANVAALVLARGAGRSKEMAIRLSLGASWTRVGLQLLTESWLLAMAGGVAGMVLALWLTQALVAHLTTPFAYVTYAINVRPDLGALAYSFAGVSVTAGLCGIAPLLLARRVDVVDVIKRSGAGGRLSRSGRTFHALVAMQFAVSTVLLTAAGILVRTSVAAESAEPAFETAGLVTATLDMDQANLDETAGIRTYELAVERLSTIPRVTAASLTRDLPLRPGRTAALVPETGSPDAGTVGPVQASAMLVGPRYFQTLGLRLLQGRDFASAPASQAQAVVNAALAERMWPDRSPVGQVFRLNDRRGELLEVIGVVSNTTVDSVAPGPQREFYRPWSQTYSPRMTILLRVTGDPEPVLAAVRHGIREISPDLSLLELRTMDRAISDLSGQRRLPAALLTLVAALGLVLSGLGLHGVTAYGVGRRARELGIRLALGARPADVRRLVLRQGVTVAALGAAVGWATVVALGPLARHTVFGARPITVTTALPVCLILMTTTLAALFLPARWASRRDPALTLRSE